MGVGSGEGWRQSTRDPRWRHLRLALLAGALVCPATAAAQTGYTFVQIAPGFSLASDINDNNAAVGFWNGASGSRGYIWTQATGAQPLITDLAIITRFPVYGYYPKRLAINAQNVVTGQGLENGTGRAATYSATSGLVILGGGDTTATGRAINAAGVVVGTYRGNSTHPVRVAAGHGVRVSLSFGPSRWADRRRCQRRRRGRGHLQCRKRLRGPGHPGVHGVHVDVDGRARQPADRVQCTHRVS